MTREIPMHLIDAAKDIIHDTFRVDELESMYDLIDDAIEALMEDEKDMKPEDKYIESQDDRKTVFDLAMKYWAEKQADYDREQAEIKADYYKNGRKLTPYELIGMTPVDFLI